MRKDKMMSKWIYNQETPSLFLPEGAVIRLVSPDEWVMDYECYVDFFGPINGVFEGHPLYANAERLFRGTNVECKDYIDYLAYKLGAFSLPVSNGTPIPKEVREKLLKEEREKRRRVAEATSYEDW
jgi:hypothetical protein